MRKIAIVDDHILVRKGLSEIIHHLSGYTVLFEADNGEHFIEQLDPLNLPHLVLLDIMMPKMNGFETAKWISNHYPQINIMVLSTLSDERTVLKMFKYGAKGYLTKDSILSELSTGLDAIFSKGMYFNLVLYANLIYTIKNGVEEAGDEYSIIINLPEREKEFLRHLCTDKSLKQIAGLMNISPRTVDGYRDNLYRKASVSNRIGLVLFAIKNDLNKL
ncbi:MAG: DNA-binding response regulator [Sphingobacteriia bacterium]|nr:MAG: DNA-binding response regulator [Sphingobacteriia bacterium]TAG31326.1 MAG: DNA-binding response regulator [Sphingobacteriia bacterium]